MVEISGVQLDLINANKGVDENADASTQLRDITAQATLKYSVKDYSTAADLYSKATELQAEINGELSLENADLLYAYGRCLYHVAVRNSDVLGSNIAGEKSEDGNKLGGKRQRKQKLPNEADGQQKGIVEGTVTNTNVVEGKNTPNQPSEKADMRSKPYFQFTGDENFDTSDEEEEEGADAEAEDAEDAEEEDDFANAYEVLDLARVLLLKKLEESDNSSGKGKEKWEPLQVQQLKERLADTYDLQAEISLEGERFSSAVLDLRSALQLKKELFPQESSLVAEAHFKLSLALEFSSVTQPEKKNGDLDSDTRVQFDESTREEAALEMKEAIASCRLRIKKEKVTLLDPLEANGNSGKPKVTKGDIADVKEMVKEMEQRLVELRQPQVSINRSFGTETIDSSNPLGGILESILGESPAAQKVRLEQASRGATDLTSLIKRTKPAQSEASKDSELHGTQRNGKRKADFRDEVQEVGTGKKARTSDGAEG